MVTKRFVAFFRYTRFVILCMCHEALANTHVLTSADQRCPRLVICARLWLSASAKPCRLYFIFKRRRYIQPSSVAWIQSFEGRIHNIKWLCLNSKTRMPQHIQPRFNTHEPTRTNWAAWQGIKCQMACEEEHYNMRAFGAHALDARALLPWIQYSDRCWHTIE